MNLFSKIFKFGFGVLSVAAMVFLFTTVPLEAAKMPKVDICHLDQETGLFTLLNISANAQQAHFNHGDKEVPSSRDCNEHAPKVFARAYINVDGIDGYDQAVDILIAQLVDTNSDGAPSAGDELQLEAYPTKLDASQTGLFQVQSLAVDSVGTLSATDIPITVTNGVDAQLDTVHFKHTSNLETFTEEPGFCGGGSPQLIIQDSINSSSFDRINVNTFDCMLSKPNTNASFLLVLNPADNILIDVDIDLNGLP